MRTTLTGLTLAVLISPLSLARAEALDATANPGEILVATMHAQGAQVYECKAEASKGLSWQFREPIATLLVDGKTVGRHFAGPTWELAEGSTITAKVTARAPGATGNDIPHLELEVTSRREAGQLSGVTTIRRLDTKGGVAGGPCERAGMLLSAPYSADYAFYKKND